MSIVPVVADDEDTDVVAEWRRWARPSTAIRDGEQAGLHRLCELAQAFKEEGGGDFYFWKLGNLGKK